MIHGDITREPADAIVNAANNALQHGGGVAAAIARAGGTIIQRESDDWIARHGDAAHDRPAVTGAGKLPAKYVIHAVGPIMGSGDEANKLRKTLNAAISTARDLKVGCLSLPAISCGIYRVPTELVAQVYADVFLTAKTAEPYDMLIKIVLFETAVLETFMDTFDLTVKQR